ncbi:hypothetical protein N7478_010145 [Penicillium angulare]|uniref:uncharacterized protein n=1 Tax=Penicillium angulare TaxID=116970 RepID=UPI002541383D|nr:uncharacterized protein N7478_010145 [Penicillium angulare]KAJ5267337.1 hypothetical protein N7478_010145 [Penicillium angulare]
MYASDQLLHSLLLFRDPAAQKQRIATKQPTPYDSHKVSQMCGKGKTIPAIVPLFDTNAEESGKDVFVDDERIGKVL